MTAEERAKKATLRISSHAIMTDREFKKVEKILLQEIKEAMRDQRHACAEAVSALPQFNKTGEPVVFKEEAYQAVMNA